MEVSARSWHYRYLSWVDKRIDTNMTGTDSSCVYVWFVVLYTVIIPLLLGIILTAFTGMMIGIIITFIANPFTMSIVLLVFAGLMYLFISACIGRLLLPRILHDMLTLFFRKHCPKLTIKD